MIDSFLNKSCFACQSGKLDVQFSTGDVVCVDCGEVISHVISEGNEVLDYSRNDDSAHHTSRVSGLSSSFISSQTEFVDGPEHIRVALKRAQIFSQDKQESTITKNICVVNDYCDRLSLGRSIQPLCCGHGFERGKQMYIASVNDLYFPECAIDLFAKVVRQRLVGSKSKEPVIAACVYLASRLKHCPRTMQEVSLALYVEQQILSHYQNAIAQGLKLPLGQASVGPEHLVNRYCSQLRLPPQCSAHAYDMARAVTVRELFTDTPQRVAGGVILWVAVLNRVELDLVELSVVCQVRLAQLKVMFIRLYDSLVLTLSPALCEVFCGRPTTAEGLSAYLPVRENISSLLGKSKTVVLPAVKHHYSASALPTSSSSSSGSTTSSESSGITSVIPTAETEEFLFNYNYYAKKRHLEAEDDTSLADVTVGGKSWIASYLPYTRPEYIKNEGTSLSSRKGLVVCSTLRKRRMLSNAGVTICDDVVDVPSLIQGFGLQTVFKPFKRMKIEESNTMSASSA